MIQLPEVQLGEGKLFLTPDDAEMSDPAVVGPKAAHLNQLAHRVQQNPPSLPDSNIHLEIAKGFAFPFRTFVHILKLWKSEQGFGNRIRLLQTGPRNDVPENLDAIRDIFTDRRECLYFR